MSGSPRFGALDRFRPLAALLVVALHTYPLADVSPDAEFLLTRVLVSVTAVPTTFFVDETGAQIGQPILGAQTEDAWRETLDAMLDQYGDGR